MQEGKLSLLPAARTKQEAAHSREEKEERSYQPVYGRLLWVLRVPSSVICSPFGNHLCNESARESHAPY